MRKDLLCMLFCSQYFSNRISDVRAMHSGYVLSDHSPLFFSIKSDLSPTPITKSVSSANQCRIDWARVSDSDIHKYCSLVSKRITSLQSDVVVCSLSNCSVHHFVLDSYGSHLVSTLLSCAYECFPTCSSSTHGLESVFLQVERVFIVLAQDLEGGWLSIIWGSFST